MYDMTFEIITEPRLVIEIAKYIKKKSKELKDVHTLKVDFLISLMNGQSFVTFGDRHYSVDTYIEAKNVLNQSLQETRCDGRLEFKGGLYTITMFGKPVRPYLHLEKLVKKYSGFEMDRKSLRTDRFEGESLKTDYMCYDPVVSQSAIDFIRANRVTKDVMVCSMESIIDGDKNINGLNILIGTKGGKVKSTKTFYIS
jgi:hypothetical protein